MICLIAACFKMQEELFPFLLHMKKLIKQIVCNHPDATGHLFIMIVVEVKTLRPSLCKTVFSGMVCHL